jgi:hypothetical protein
MHPPHTPRFTEWQAAEREAQAAERVLYEAMLGYAKGIATAPPQHQVNAARTARARANALFEPAMQEMAVLARSLDHRRINTVPRDDMAAAPVKTDDARPAG